MARKNSVRTVVTLLSDCDAKYPYHTQKNKRNDPERIKLTKYCPHCRERRVFTEKR